MSCSYGKAPTRQLHSIPIAVSASGHTRKKIDSLDAVIHMQQSPPQKRFLVGLMQLTLHATRPPPPGASRFGARAMSAWSVKTRRAPSRHCRNASVYGRTTTGMHDNEYSPALFGRKSPPKFAQGGMLSCVLSPWPKLRLTFHVQTRLETVIIIPVKVLHGYPYETQKTRRKNLEIDT